MLPASARQPGRVPKCLRAGIGAVKQQVLKRARDRIEACLRKQSSGAGLNVLSVDVKVDGDGDEFLWVYLKYDDSDGAGGLPDTHARIRLMDHLHSELADAEVDAFPVFSFVAESDIDSVPE